MARRRRGNTTFRTAVILLSFVSGVMLMTTADVHAQGLFDAFTRIFGGWAAQLPSDKRIDPDGPAVAYCVRLCDGHYFPMPKNAGTPHSSPDKICSALCPASPTKIYTGSEINQASAADGTSYSKIENAFLYRERMIPACTCTGKDIGGTAVIDIHSDPTLRSGDIVATKDGLMVFKGSKQVPYRTSDFIPVEDYKGPPAGVRRTLAELRVAPELNSADLNVTMSLVPPPESPRLSTFDPQTTPALDPRDTPVAEVFPIFSFPMF
jgi:Protein of unknown function (DUF2865)